MFFVPAADPRNEGDRFRFLTVGRTLECALGWACRREDTLERQR